MNDKLIAVTPLAPALGAEVSGVDLSRPLDDDAVAEIRRAFRDFLVLFFRGQSLTPDALVAFARLFGPVGTYPFAEPIPDHPNVIAIVKEPHQTTNFGGIWHSDTPYLERPSLGSVLYAREVPPAGGDTLWANMHLAWERLPAERREMLAPLRAMHTAAKNKDVLRAGPIAAAGMRGRRLERVDTEQAEHPVARTHPVTGRKSLYVSPAHTTRLSGMTGDESAPILEELFAHATRDEFTCRFRWMQGSLAVWDNCCTLHYPLNDYHGHRREMHRVTIDGGKPA